MPRWWLLTCPGKVRTSICRHKGLEGRARRDVAEDHAALGPEEGLVGRTGHDVGALRPTGPGNTGQAGRGHGLRRT